jgi:hypothetical protein
MVLAKSPADEPTTRAAILARSLAMQDPIVNSVRLPAKYAASIPGVPNLATSLAHHARKTAHGRALTLGDAIYLALFLATNCHARNAVRKFSNVDINVPLCVERSAHRLATARFAVQKKSKASLWNIC